jgi:hypothetical protein
VDRVNAVLCDRVRAFVSLELDGELSELERSILESHTEDCRACREFRVGVSGFTAALRASPQEAVSRSFRFPRRPNRLAPFSTAGAAAAAAVVVAGLAAVLTPLAGDGGPVEIKEPTPTERFFDVGDGPLSTIRPTDGRGIPPVTILRAL